MSQLSQGDSNKPAVMQKSALYLSLSSLGCAWSLTELTVATLSFLLSSPVCTGSHRPVLARRPAGPGEHMVTSMGNIIMICIRQQSAQNIASAQECLCKIKCFRFYAIILSLPPPVINQSIWKIYNSLKIWSFYLRGNSWIMSWLWWCWHMMGTWGQYPAPAKSPLLHSLPQLCSIVMCKGYLLRSHYPALQHRNVSMQLSGLRGPTLSSHEVIWLLRRKTDPCRHAEWWLLIDSFLLRSSLQPINSVFFPRPLSVSTTHQGPPPVAGDHE